MHAHAAIESLVRQHSGGLRAMCQRMVGDAALAEDVLQNAFIQAMRGWSGYAGRGNELAWLRRIASRCAIAALRERGRWVADEPALGHLELTPTEWPCALQDRQQRLQAVQLAIDTLTERERLAFVLRHVEQFELEEIAEQLECSVNNCKQTIFRGVQKMRHHLADWRSES